MNCSLDVRGFSGVFEFARWIGEDALVQTLRIVENLPRLNLGIFVFRDSVYNAMKRVVVIVGSHVEHTALCRILGWIASNRKFTNEFG